MEINEYRTIHAIMAIELIIFSIAFAHQKRIPLSSLTKYMGVFLIGVTIFLYGLNKDLLGPIYTGLVVFSLFFYMLALLKPIKVDGKWKS